MFKIKLTRLEKAILYGVYIFFGFMSWCVADWIGVGGYLLQGIVTGMFDLKKLENDVNKL